MLYALILSATAGLATTLGGVLSILYRKGDHKWLSASLGFSAGVMIYVSFVELFANGQSILIEYFGSFKGGMRALISFLIGIMVVIAVNRLIPDLCEPDIGQHNEGRTGPSKSLWRTGMLTTIVIALHNFPEGMVTFLGSLENPRIGLMISIAIAIHNIPEGMAVYIPVYEATHNRKKAMWMTFLSGMTEPIGALLAYFLLMPVLTPVLLQQINIAIAGIMVYISLDELLPAAKEYGHYHLAMLGLTSGMIVMGLSLVLLS